MKEISKRAQEAADVLLDAYNSRTLGKGTCAACAVGNLLAAKNGTIDKISLEEEVSDDDTEHVQPWLETFIYMRNSLHVTHPFLEEGKKQLSVLDFTVEELERIEAAFENSTKICYTLYSTKLDEDIREDQMSGLIAVMEVIRGFDDCPQELVETFQEDLMKNTELAHDPI